MNLKLNNKELVWLLACMSVGIGLKEDVKIAKDLINTMQNNEDDIKTLMNLVDKLDILSISLK